jgi:hypothetical protein
MKKYYCRLCDRILDSLDGGVEISTGRHGKGRRIYKLYQWPDKSIHDVRVVSVQDPPPPEPPQVQEVLEDPQLDPEVTPVPQKLLCAWFVG